MGRYYDFHIHTSCSDGSLSPGEVVRRAIENGANTIAITDHYTLAGVDYARQIANKKLTIIPGIEISAQAPKSKRLHIVGLYVNKSIYSLVDYYETKRKVLVEDTILKLRKQNFKITYDDVKAYCRDRSSIGRYDIAITLASMHYSDSANKAYEDILLNKKVYVEREKLEAKEVIDAIIHAKGVPILAHPNSLRIGGSNFEERIEQLVSYGIRGIEVYTPHILEDKREYLLNLCEKYSLIPSVGSDFHRIREGFTNLKTGIENDMCIDDPKILRKIKKEKSHISKHQ